MTEALFSALVQVMQFPTVLWLILGVGCGIVVGAIPGLGGGMLISLTIPLTFGMNATDALVMMIGMYVGAVSGGMVSATLLRMPGTPSAVMTTFDGHPMAARGEAGRALGLGVTASLVGGLIAGVFLVVMSPPLAKLALTFGPWEYFSMVLLAVVLIAALSKGSMAKGLLGGALGIAFALPGLNESDGQLRLTFGVDELADGFNLLPVLLGVFVMSQIIRDTAAAATRTAPPIMAKFDKTKLPGLRDLRRHGGNMMRSSVIGTFVGVLPGVGASIASMIAYGTARSLSKTPEKFGTGCEEGIVASESANNSNVGGALVPLITMGIPGSPIDAILLGALVLHQIQPGPLLFVTNGEFVWALMAAYLIANVLMFAMMVVALPGLARIVRIKTAYLMPAIFVFCVIGAFGLSNRMFDVYVVIGFGLVGVLLERAKVPVGPFVIGFVLASILEAELRSGLQASGGSYLPMLTRPVSLFFVLSAGVLLALQMIPRRGSKA